MEVLSEFLNWIVLFGFLLFCIISLLMIWKYFKRIYNQNKLVSNAKEILNLTQSLNNYKKRLSFLIENNEDGEYDEIIEVTKIAIKTNELYKKII